MKKRVTKNRRVELPGKKYEKEREGNRTAEWQKGERKKYQGEREREHRGNWTRRWKGVRKIITKKFFLLN